MLPRFPSAFDADRAVRTLRLLTRHDVHRWALTGGLAFEIHAVRLGRQPTLRTLSDLDFIADSIDCIPQTLPDDFLFRHIHPFDPPGKTMLQLIDPDTGLRVDVFRACGQTMSRTVRIDLPFGPMQLVSLEDLVARAARLLLDLANGVPVASKHAGDYLRFVELADSEGTEVAWKDHRKPMQPATFRETGRVLPDLIRARPNLLITPEYSKNAQEVCPRCAPSAVFHLADPNVVLELLGYC
jgi:hypothetical protein